MVPAHPLCPPRGGRPGGRGGCCSRGSGEPSATAGPAAAGPAAAPLHPHATAAGGQWQCLGIPGLPHAPTTPGGAEAAAGAAAARRGPVEAARAAPHGCGAARARERASATQRCASGSRCCQCIAAGARGSQQRLARIWKGAAGRRQVRGANGEGREMDGERQRLGDFFFTAFLIDFTAPKPQASFILQGQGRRAAGAAWGHPPGRRAHWQGPPLPQQNALQHFALPPCRA